MIPPERFTLSLRDPQPPAAFTTPTSQLDTSSHLTTYTFNTGLAKHLFCKVCGIHSFYRPRSHPNHFDVNIRCLDNYQLIKDRFAVTPYDGRNWEDNISKINDDASVIEAAKQVKLAKEASS